MSAILNAIFENEVLKEKVKFLLVENGYYKEARELMECKKIIKIDPKLIIVTEPIMIMQNGAYNSKSGGKIKIKNEHG